MDKFNTEDLKEEKLEGEVDEENSSSDEVYPAEVRVNRAQFSCSHVKILVEKRHELEISPEFQRNNVWKSSQMSELVESILMGIPIPVIYLFEDRDGNKQIVDGKQRITTIIDFQDDKFTLNGLHVMPSFNGKKFSTLPPKMRGAFEDYQLSFYIIQPPTPERVKYDIFDRVNRGGTQLTHQEMREALYMGKATEMLKYLRMENGSFLKATGNSIPEKRKKDTYLILRSVSFMLLWGFSERVKKLNNGKDISYKSDIDDFLASTMIFLNNKADDGLIKDLEHRFLSSMDYIYDIMGSDGFRFAHEEGSSRRPVSMPLFETLTYVFSFPVVNKNPLRTKQIVSIKKKDWDMSGSFNGSNVDSVTKVVERKELIDEILNELYNYA
ncbi:DUF262 domain-containing protein [Prevotella lacticifex]|jgi:hypothetical protein|uniref:GmrSD restriction endonucleases N-terminal domain-containing protein n=1 Tax=Prevotella lacticifex TaxID=2854755 RepID=A0A9R1C7L7_9BACT|nr:DUF262 domain-containing protein [Prevotella lacticifex]MEE3416009.1 DUF262 domain-containing protein [Prevotella sp.]GJG37252.1 hypothetical protein PRLR5003_24090 [Prevotella lacticifex]GJG40248.1 hypothetical protein PRLR5019_22190 [Prevotella lacticifex]GJG43942.1 hypothetical protein PRLR5025_27280 [Prevotella lacticifex]GJG46626.1 hypothetical protein PRLR5027_22210 [Prevotella lacticifex]